MFIRCRQKKQKNKKKKTAVSEFIIEKTQALKQRKKIRAYVRRFSPC